MSREGTFEVEDDYLFLGRTFAEYRRMFGLAPDDLPGRSVLDCPGGPGSFTAVASSLGVRATAVDPVYGPPVAALESACEDAVERGLGQLREKRDLFVLDEYDGVADAVEIRGQYLRAASERFLADYARHPGRYVAAALPDLPFATGAFDLVLSGNFLFLYDDRLDLAFHREALRELARVAGEEVRVFPLAALDRERSTFVEPATADLREAGLSVEHREVSYEFQPGATEMLAVSGVEGYRGD